MEKFTNATCASPLLILIIAFIMALPALSVRAKRTTGDLAARLVNPDGTGWPHRAGYVLLRLAGPTINKPDIVYWRDPQTSQTWITRQYGGGWLQNMKDLPAGTYRVAATGDFGHEGAVGPSGMSDPVTVEPGKQALAKVQLQAGSLLTIHVKDAQTGQGLDRVHMKLVHANGFPVCHGMMDRQPDRTGAMTFTALTPGDYRLSVYRPNHHFNDTPYQPRENMPLTVKDLPRNVLEIALERRILTPQEIDQRWPFIVEGRITDADGKPMPGVAVEAPWTLLYPRQNTVTTSGLDGRYRIRFNTPISLQPPSMISPIDKPLPMSIRAHKPGYLEKSLGRAGNIEVPHVFPLIDIKSGREISKSATPSGGDRLIQPGKPYAINFTMIPAMGPSGGR